MALSIKDEATDRLVRRYAAVRRTSYTRAIAIAVTEALRREGEAVDEDEERARRDLRFREAVRAVQEHVATLPELDPRSPDEILYDEDGVPH